MELSARQQSRAEWSSLEEDPTAGHGPSCATYQNRGPPPRCEGALQRQSLRQMYITSLARASRAAVSLPGPRSFLEHPEDPVVSSSLPKAKGMLILLDHRGGAALDGRKLLDSNLLRPVPPGPAGQEGHYASHGPPNSGLGSNAVHAPVTCGHQRVLDSQQIPLGYDGRPGQSHRCVTRSAGAHPDPLTIPEKNPKEPPKGPSWNNEPRLPISHAPDGRRCGTTGEGGTWGPGPPECLPAFRVPLPRLTDRVAIVQLGFRSRPLRDGGGKPSPGGGSTPPFGVMTLTRPWIDKVRLSLASGATTHPFQEELRAILGPRHLHERCPGQPFLWT